MCQRTISEISSDIERAIGLRNCDHAIGKPSIIRVDGKVVNLKVTRSSARVLEIVVLQNYLKIAINRGQQIDSKNKSE